jgi:outer membrane lipoprotein-sorting protein
MLLGSRSLPCQGADTNVVLDSWFAAQAKVHTWSADFTQTRTLKTLTQPLVTQGHLAFAAPGEFRWELGRPARTMAVRSDDEMFVVYPRLKRAEHYSLGKSIPKEMRDTLSLLQAGFPRDRQEFEAQFQILSLTPINDDWLLALQPKSMFARQMMPELLLGLSTNDFSLASTELVFVDGSRMRSDFTNVLSNLSLDPGLFQWTPPADFKVTKPFDQ